MMENKRDLSAVVSLRDKSLCIWYLFFAHIQAGDITPGFKPWHHVKAWGIKITPTQSYYMSDIQRVSYCRGYLSRTARTSYTTMAISHLHDYYYLKSIDFKPQQDNQEQPLYIIRCKFT